MTSSVQVPNASVATLRHRPTFIPKYHGNVAMSGRHLTGDGNRDSYQGTLAGSVAWRDGVCQFVDWLCRGDMMG